MVEFPFVITFPNASSREANLLAADLGATLRELDEQIKVEQSRDRPDTQDFGATLVVLLGTAAATAVAKGVAAWMAKRGGSTITISADGTVVAKNLGPGDAAEIAKAFSTRRVV